MKKLQWIKKKWVKNCIEISYGINVKSKSWYNNSIIFLLKNILLVIDDEILNRKEYKLMFL